MGFFKKIGGLFNPMRKPEPKVLTVSVKCNRCGEILQARINLLNEPSIQYEEGSKPTYYVRKVVMSNAGHCFQQIELEYTFDSDRNVLQRKIQGGTFVDELPSKS